MLLSLVVASCTSDDMQVAEEVGYLKLEMNTVVSAKTRGAVNDPANYAPKQLYVEIVDASNNVVMSTTDFANDTEWNGTKLQLKAGKYTINAHSNGWDGSGSGFDTPFYAGSTDVTIKANTISSATVKCTQANVKVTVNFDKSFSDNFKSATSEFSSEDEEVAAKKFEMGKTTQSAYFPVGDLKAKLAVVNNNGKEFSQENTITDVKARDHYIITYAVASGSLGGVSVVVNDEARTYEYTISIGYPSDIAIDTKVTPSYVSALVEGQVKTTSSTVNPSYITLQYRKKGANNWTDVVNADLTTDAKGNVSYNITGLSATTTYECRINYDDPAAGLTEGETVEFTTTEFFSNLSASSDLSFTATLMGTMGDAAAASNVSVQWKKTTDANWTTVADGNVTVSGAQLSAKVSGLNASDSYEFRLVCSDPAIESSSKSFKTKGMQPENRSFENWHWGSFSSYNVWFPNAEGEQYWDSSNPGSGSMGENYNVTTRTTDYVHSGTYAAKLKSTYVIIKFAAASLYTGSFGELVGTKGAKLNWGVPFTDMPTALKGFRIAQPGTVNRVGSGMPTGYPAKGETDHQSIYCALLTEQLQVDNTDMSTFPDWATDSRVIAYGQLTMTTSDSGWTEFSIPLEYHGSVRQPAYLLIVASSSKYGDYFHGSDASCMYLDDLELVYDGNYTVK